MSNVQNILKTIKEKEIQFVDLRFTDPRGKMQHVSQHVSTIDEDSLAEGFMFDGSSIAGWKAINESDMKLMPDLSRAYIDPFFSQTTLAVFCDVLDPITGEPYERDPRGTFLQSLAKRYEQSFNVQCLSVFEIGKNYLANSTPWHIYQKTVQVKSNEKNRSNHQALQT